LSLSSFRFFFLSLRGFFSGLPVFSRSWKSFRSLSLS
jgi:hypothetical protein